MSSLRNVCLILCCVIFAHIIHPATAPSTVRFRGYTDEAESQATHREESDDTSNSDNRNKLHNLLRQSFSQHQSADRFSGVVRRTGAKQGTNYAYENTKETYNYNIAPSDTLAYKDIYVVNNNEPLESSNYENEIELTNNGGKLTQKKKLVFNMFSQQSDTKKQQPNTSPESPASALNEAQKLHQGTFSQATQTHHSENKPPVDNNNLLQLAKKEDRGDVNSQFNRGLWEAVDGVYWSPQLERLTPTAFRSSEQALWRSKISAAEIKAVQEGCGRMQNRLIVLQDGSKFCARYRINNDQIQGEVYSYYLAQLLGISNVPPPILDIADATSERWRPVSPALEQAHWSSRKPLVLTPYVERLQAAYIPPELRSEQRKLAPITVSLVNKTVDELVELVQWSDLILLDYLTANVDRVVNNMFNLQWSPNIMSAPTHNLEKSTDSGALVFMDNESGLVHSYRLLDKYSQYHDSLLGSLCMFRRDTVAKVKQLHKTGRLAEQLQRLFVESEPLADKLSPLPAKNIQTLNQRLGDVYKHIAHCERTYRTR